MVLDPSLTSVSLMPLRTKFELKLPLFRTYWIIFQIKIFVTSGFPETNMREGNEDQSRIRVQIEKRMNGLTSGTHIHLLTQCK